MAKRELTSGDQHFRETEEVAYHAFREWPVFLLIRQKELEGHLTPAEVKSAAVVSSSDELGPVSAPQLSLTQPIPETPLPISPAKTNKPVATTDEVQLALASIEWRGGTQARVKGVNPSVVSEYAARMRDGERPPAITVFFDGQKYWPADGFHRAAAAQMNGETSISAEVKA